MKTCLKDGCGSSNVYERTKTGRRELVGSVAFQYLVSILKTCRETGRSL
jgi:hypothetical protein